jgi:hypothetical protein
LTVLEAEPIFPPQFDLNAALKRALGGGLSGAAAMILQVLLLMPVRTIMNYQYRHGTSLSLATNTLYQDGGLARYYQGLGPALVQGKIIFPRSFFFAHVHFPLALLSLALR